MNKYYSAAVGLVVSSLMGCVGSEPPTASSSTQTTASSQSSVGAGPDPQSSSSMPISSSMMTSSSAAGTPNTITIEENTSGFCGLVGVIDTEHAGFGGTGFADTENVTGSTIQWKINSSTAQTITATIRYANGGGSGRPGALSIDGQASANYMLGDTGAWDNWQEESYPVSVSAGDNTLLLTAAGSSGLANVDSIKLSGNAIQTVDCAGQPPVQSSSSATTSSEGSQSSSGPVVEAPYPPEDLGNNNNLSAACIDLVTNNNTNWDESSLGSNQEIVKCLAESLGQPVGYGQNARGGYNSNGGSNLVVIKKGTGVLPEKQILDAISTEAPNWIVLDKDDFKAGSTIAMYRLHCSDSSVLSALDNASEAECLDHTLWCRNKGVSEANCADTFFNDRLDDKNLPIRNPMIAGHTTIDGRGSEATFLFSGFKIGADSSGASTYKSDSVIVTHLEFLGAGHTEDHGLDPDMLRSTGESKDIWIHKNTFRVTGDSAFDVKVGAYNITISFNRIVDVKRSTLHGSSDSRTINEQITTTMHNNLFVTSESFYDAGRSTARRVPLLRRGKSHMFNNVFVNYWKDFASIRKGGQLLFQDNIFLGLSPVQNEKNDPADSLNEWVNDNLSDGVVSEGGFTTDGSKAIFASDNCVLDLAYQGDLVGGNGGTVDMSNDYNSISKQLMSEGFLAVGQDLVDYTSATAGKDGEVPFNSPLQANRTSAISAGRGTCTQ